MLNVTSQCSGEVVNTHRDEVSSEPRLVLHSLVHARLSAMKVHLGVVNVRVLGGGVVSPDDDVLHFVRGDTATYRHLQNRAGCGRQYNLSCSFNQSRRAAIPCCDEVLQVSIFKIEIDHLRLDQQNKGRIEVSAAITGSCCHLCNPVRVCTWELALLWSRRVRQEKFSLGIDGADLEAIRQLVFAGFPTTRT